MALGLLAGFALLGAARRSEVALCQIVGAGATSQGMDFFMHLRTATSALPDSVRRWVRLALGSGWFEIGSGSYDSGSSVCPIAAGATLAGVWDGEAIMPGYPEWGTPEEPSPAVAEFAAWFDVCCGAHGLEETLALLRSVFEERRGPAYLAA